MELFLLVFSRWNTLEDLTSGLCCCFTSPQVVELISCSSCSHSTWFSLPLFSSIHLASDDFKSIDLSSLMTHSKWGAM